MPLQLVVGPTVEPLTLDEIKAHLRIGAGNQEPNADAPVAALAAAGAGNVNNGTHRYLVTFVTADGQTAAGVSSAAVTVVDLTTDGKVALTAVPVGGSAVTSRKIYRTLAGGSTYFFLASIADNTTTVYTDNIADGSLGVGAPTTNTTGDPILARLRNGVRAMAENETRRKFATQQWKLNLDTFPGVWPTPIAWAWSSQIGYWVPSRYAQYGNLITLPFPPCITVDSIKYYDSANVQQTLVDVTDYTVDKVSEPTRILPAFAKFWPATYPMLNAVEILFTVGYVMPDGVKSWMLLMIEHYHENRGALLEVPNLTPLPFIDHLLDPYRLVMF